MHRFYLPPEQCRGSRLLLTGREAHHAAHVLRIRAGETVTVLDGAGNHFSCAVAQVARGEVTLEIDDVRRFPPPPAQITLLQAIPKGKTFELIVQKATELGAARIVPLLTERVVRQISGERAGEKSEKWQMVAVEAVKQCGAAWLPIVEPPTTPAGFLARSTPFELPLVASLQPGSKHPRAYFDNFRAKHQRNPATACVWIGPEGDFTPEEVHAMEAGGCLPITLGPLVLRTDTAANYCLSFLAYELQS
jgi:16S rRNA (uracil1498-N3)-methyltransferase